jgi:hypothetical protein
MPGALVADPLGELEGKLFVRIAECEAAVCARARSISDSFGKAEGNKPGEDFIYKGVSAESVLHVPSQRKGPSTFRPGPSFPVTTREKKNSKAPHCRGPHPPSQMFS